LEAHCAYSLQAEFVFDALRSFSTREVSCKRTALSFDTTIKRALTLRFKKTTSKACKQNRRTRLSSSPYMYIMRQIINCTLTVDRKQLGGVLNAEAAIALAALS